jgi:hypothetical protein
MSQPRNAQKIIERKRFSLKLQESYSLLAKILRFISIIGITVSLSSCHPSFLRKFPSLGSHFSFAEVSMSATIPFQTIDFGYTPLEEQFIPQPQVFIFTNHATWEQLWQSSKILDLNLQKPPAPQFDFERQTLIGLTSGSRSTGGYALRVDKIEVVTSAEGDSWILHYTELVPGRNCLVTQSPTTPTAFIAVEVPVLPIKLQGKTVSMEC